MSRLGLLEGFFLFCKRQCPWYKETSSLLFCIGFPTVRSLNTLSDFGQKFLQYLLYLTDNQIIKISGIKLVSKVIIKPDILELIISNCHDPELFQNCLAKPIP